MDPEEPVGGSYSAGNAENIGNDSSDSSGGNPGIAAHDTSDSSGDSAGIVPHDAVEPFEEISLKIMDPEEPVGGNASNGGNAVNPGNDGSESTGGIAVNSGNDGTESTGGNDVNPGTDGSENIGGKAVNPGNDGKESTGGNAVNPGTDGSESSGLSAVNPGNDGSDSTGGTAGIASATTSDSSSIGIVPRDESDSSGGNAGNAGNPEDDDNAAQEVVDNEPVESVCFICLQTLEFRWYRCLECYNYRICVPCYENRRNWMGHHHYHPVQSVLTPEARAMLYQAGDGHFAGNMSIMLDTFTCPYCGQGGFDRSTLIAHLTARHRFDDAYVNCPVCVSQPTFRNSFYLDDVVEHISTVHHPDYAHSPVPQLSSSGSSTSTGSFP